VQSPRAPPPATDKIGVADRAVDSPSTEAAGIVITLVSVRPGDSPIVALALHDAPDTRMRTEESGEVPGVDHQGPDHLERDHRGRTDAYLQCGPLADELPHAAHSQHAFGAIVVNYDLGPAAQDHHHVIGPLALLHDSPTGRKRTPGSNRSECFPLYRIKRIPEAAVAS
jgi:hypothetical protein